jgi:hypothetical protein
MVDAFRDMTSRVGINDRVQRLACRSRNLAHLICVNASPGESTPADLWAGIRFENIDYQHPQTWGWKSQLKGHSGARIRYLTFKNVTTAGERLNAAYLNNSDKFDTSFVSESIFKE